MINADNIYYGPFLNVQKIFSSPTLRLFVLCVPSMIISPTLMGNKNEKANAVWYFFPSVQILSPKKF